MIKTLIASLALATIASSAYAGDKPASCCATGTACCAKGSACCSPATKRHAVLKKGVAKKVAAKTASCCTPGSACCTGGACCAKKA